MISLTFSMHFALFMIYAEKNVGTLCIFFHIFCFEMIYLYADNINRVNLSMSGKKMPLARIKKQNYMWWMINDSTTVFVNKLSAFCSISNSKVSSTHVPISSEHY